MQTYSLIMTVYAAKESVGKLVSPLHTNYHVYLISTVKTVLLLATACTPSLVAENAVHLECCLA